MKKLTIDKNFKGKIFFTSDTHFDHSNIIKYCVRPFKTKEEMNKHLIKCWNEVVSPNDIVFHLGDVCFGTKGKWNSFLSALNGTKYLIQGNHDKLDDIPQDQFKMIEDILQVSLYDDEVEEWVNLILCHYCLQTWPGQWKGWMHCFGHSHSKPGNFPDSKHLINRNLPSYDVGVDNNNYTPIEYTNLKTIFTKQLLYGK